MWKRVKKHKTSNVKTKMDFLGSNPSDLFIDDYPTEFSWLSSEAFLAGNETFQNISRQLEPSGKFNIGL